MSPYVFLYSLKSFGDNYGVRGSRFDHMFGRSKNIPKSIVIDQESLISYLGIIKTPNKLNEYIENQENPKHRFFRCRFVGPIRPRFGPMISLDIHGYLWTWMSMDVSGCP